MRIAKSRILLLGMVAALLSSGAVSVFGQSKYAKIKNGVGNILIGEELPYNNDSGYKNVVIDSVKLSQMREWETFYIRAYFAKKIGEIDHDRRVFVLHFEGVGKRSARFDREVGGNYLIVKSREKDSASYGERSEWSLMYPDFQTDPEALVLVSYIKAFDHTKPETFTLRTLNEDIGDDLPFNAQALSEWKDTYGLSSVVVTMHAYSFIDGGEKCEGVMKTVLRERSDGSFEQTEELAGVKTFTIWEDRKFLATGKFTILLD